MTYDFWFFDGLPVGSAMEWANLWVSLLGAFGGTFLAFRLATNHEREKLDRGHREVRNSLCITLSAAKDCLAKYQDPQIRSGQYFKGIEVYDDREGFNHAWRTVVALRATLEGFEQSPHITKPEQLFELEVLRATVALYDEKLDRALRNLALGGRGGERLDLHEIACTVEPQLGKAIEALGATELAQIT